MSSPVLALALSLATPVPPAAAATGPPSSLPSEVVVIGTIHDDHLDSERYGLAFLEEVVRAVAPDDVLAEIPPDRYPVALAQWVEDRWITEPGVVRLPEVAQVVIPLSRLLDFRIVPVAGWTQESEEERLARVEEIRDDPDRRADWFAYQAAWEEADGAMMAGGAVDDPLWIHTDAYDAALEIALGAYDRLFGDEPGGAVRDRGNEASWTLVADALDEVAGQGRRVLLLFGAEHKGRFLRRLREREDVLVLDPGPFLEEARRRTP